MRSAGSWFITLFVLAGCSRPFDGSIDLLGYLGVGLQDRPMWYYAHGDGPRLRVRAPADAALPPLRVRFVPDGGRPQRLTVIRTSTFAEGWLLDLDAPVTSGDVVPGFLELPTGPRRVVWTRGLGAWPRVQTATGSVDALRAFDRAETFAVERLAARKALAQAIRRRDGLKAYAEVQTQTASLAATLGLWSFASDALSAAAYAEESRRNFDGVWPLLDRARRASKRVNDERGLTRARLVQGYAATELGRHDAALAAFRQASQMALSIGMPDLWTFAEIGAANRLQEIGQFEAARRTLLRLGRYIEKDASKYERMIWLNDLGWLEARALEGRASWASFETADGYLAAAVELGVELERPSSALNSLANRVYLAFVAGRRADVRTHLAALERMPRAQESHGRFLADMVAASLQIRSDPKNAATLFTALHQRSLDESAGEGSEYTWRCLLGLAESYEASGALDKASSAYMRAIEALERTTQHASLRSGRAGFLDDRARLFDRAAALVRRRGQAWESFSILERKRGQLFSGLDRDLTRQRLGPEQTRRAEVLRIRYLALRDRLEGRGRQRQTVPPTEIEAFDRETASLRQQVFARAKAYFDFLDDVAPNRGRGVLDRAALRAVLAGQRAIIVAPERAGKRWLVHVVSARSTQVKSVAALPDMPLPLRGVQHVFLVPSESVSVPELVAVFPRVLPKATVSILPWAQLLIRPRSTERLQEPASLVLGDSRSDLPFARREAKSIAARVEAQTLLIGPQATLERLLAGLRVHQHFHFSGHGLLSAADPWASRLALARDRAFTLEALLLAEHRVERVVLSGCETGKRVRLSERYAIGLPEAWLLTGARSVVATTRAIDDQAALDFMQRFYDAAGASAPEAAYRTVALQMGEADPFWKLFYVESLGPDPG